MKSGRQTDTLRHAEWKPELKYISGPIAHGDRDENMHRAIMVGEFWYRQGYPVFLPHLFHHWDLFYAHPYEDWMRVDLMIINRMKSGDELVRLPGKSGGSDREVGWAMRRPGINIKIMTVADCEEIEEALGESFPYLPEGQTNLKGLTHPGQ